ncbi:MAG: small metal-binding protein SmbP [Gammaproteobacteria bacterium]
MKKTFLTALLAGAFAFGMSNAFAQGVSSGKDRDLNTEQMNQAQTHAKAALEAAKGGDAPGVAEHARKSWNFCKEVTGETVMPYYDPAMEKLQTAISVAEKGDAAGAVPPLEGALADMAEGLAKMDY